MRRYELSSRACLPPSPPPTMANPSYNIVLPTPVQCEELTITWSGSASDTKAIAAFVQGTDYFAELLVNNLTDPIGNIDWLCDFPAGAFISFELYSMPDAARYAVSPFLQVQPGKTDACLRSNAGQLAVSSMATLAASLSSASPQLFSYPPTSASASSTPAPTPTAQTSSLPEPSSSSSPSHNEVNIGAVAGGVVGGIAFVLAVAACVFFVCRRKNRSHLGSSASATEKGSRPDEGAGGTAGDVGGFFRSRSVNPVDAWRNRVEGGRPPSAWTRRSRALSGASAPLDAISPTSPPTQAQPLPATPPSGHNPFTTTSSRSGIVSAPPPPSQGPRAGVPEVGGDSDFPYGGPYGQQTATSGGGASGMYSSLASRSHGGDLADPASFERGRGGSSTAYPPAQVRLSQELLSDGAPATEGQGPIRPPTRLTTPGGLTSYGGEASRRDSQDEPAYASYSRP
ncbi:hypothetical protein JCM10213_009288 [Rhodosporidiobolus nylandii]